MSYSTENISVKIPIDRHVRARRRSGGRARDFSRRCARCHPRAPHSTTRARPDVQPRNGIVSGSTSAQSSRILRTHSKNMMAQRSALAARSIATTRARSARSTVVAAAADRKMWCVR